MLLHAPSRDFDEAASAVGSIELPTPFAPNRQAFQREVARRLERARLKPDARPPA